MLYKFRRKSYEVLSTFRSSRAGHGILNLCDTNTNSQTFSPFGPVIVTVNYRLTL